MSDGFITSTEFCRDTACFIAWADHWQTLVGAAIAIPLAAVAILVPVYQETARIGRRADALRASLPIRLAEITNYASEVLIAVGQCRTSTGVSATALKGFKAPQIPPTLVDGLERTIEALNVRRVRRRLGKIIEQIQVLNTRLLGLDEDSDPAWLDSQLVEAGIIYAQAEALFDYARRRTPSTPRHLNWDDVAKAAHIARLFDVMYVDLYETLRRYKASGIDPEHEADNHPAVVKLSAWIEKCVKRQRTGR